MSLSFSYRLDRFPAPNLIHIFCPMKVLYLSLITHTPPPCCRYVYTSLAHLRHSNGSPVVIVYCHGRYADPSQQGPIINFNVLRSDGRVVGYSEVDKLACVYDIHLRTGCFCNTGACMRYLDVSAERVKEHLKVSCGEKIQLYFYFRKGCVLSIECVMFSELSLRGCNLCFERPISKKLFAFSSCLIVLQYGAVKSVIYFGLKLSIF